LDPSFDADPRFPMTPKNFKHHLAKRIIALTILVLIATTLSELAMLHWFAELFSHFKPHYTVFALFCVLGLALLRSWRWAAVAIALALWNSTPLMRTLLPEDEPATIATARQFTIFHFNVGLHHKSPQRIMSYLAQHACEIDVVVLLEADNQFDITLDEIKGLFPYQIKYLKDSPFGIALLSKHMIDFGKVALQPSQLYPHIEATIKLPGRATPLALYAVHAPPPISGDMAEARNAKLTYIASKAAAQAQATPVVIGDFNLTPWSPYFLRFITESGLRDVRTPHRFDHTWPVIFDNTTLGLAIDHSFAHPALPLIKRTIGPDLGSDHLPATVSLGY
jgi:endonuclease/exonuclease/phosphatase (EEP) superfamily protein YafD